VLLLLKTEDKDIYVVLEHLASVFKRVFLAITSLKILYVFNV